jgi:hypothetical protein
MLFIILFESFGMFSLGLIRETGQLKNMRIYTYMHKYICVYVHKHLCVQREICRSWLSKLYNADA